MRFQVTARAMTVWETRDSRKIRQKQQQNWQQVKNTYGMATKIVMLFLRFYAYVACCCCWRCCYYFCCLATVKAYWKPVSSYARQWCCALVCVFVCAASPLARPSFYLRLLSPPLSHSFALTLNCTGCCHTHTIHTLTDFCSDRAVEFQWQRTFLYNGK